MNDKSRFHKLWSSFYKYLRILSLIWILISKTIFVVFPVCSISWLWMDVDHWLVVSISRYTDSGFTVNGVQYEGSLLCVGNLMLSWSPKKMSDITTNRYVDSSKSFLQLYLFDWACRKSSVDLHITFFIHLTMTYYMQPIHLPSSETHTW